MFFFILYEWWMMVNLLIINTLTSWFTDARTELNNITAKFHNTLVTTAKIGKRFIKRYVDLMPESALVKGPYHVSQWKAICWAHLRSLKFIRTMSWFTFRSV